MANWMRERWPMDYLHPAVRWQLANSLDVITPTGLGYPTFAAELRIQGRLLYTAQNIELIRARSQQHGSITYSLLLDYETRGGTVQGVQRALENIGHRAAGYIPAYLESITSVRAQTRAYPEQYADLNGTNPYPVYSGYQNTEPRSCNCPECHGQYSGPSSSSRPRERERSIPNSSVYTGPSETRRRIPSRRSNERTSFESPNVQNVTERLLHMDERNNIAQDPFQRGINGEINNVCPCDDCRLQSDSEQTQRLTLQSDPKAPCLHRPVHQIAANNGNGHDAFRTSDDISSGLSQLYLDSEESSETSVNDVECSDETFMKSVVSESQSVGSRGIPTENVVTSSGGPLCSRSDMRRHRLGEMVENCPVCGNYAGAKPKKGQRPRNMSGPQKNGIPDTDLRKSWHGTPNGSNEEKMKKISSDSVLLQSSNSNHQSRHPNLIEETVYSRISSSSSDNSGCRRGDSGTNSADILGIGDHSVNDIYQNNLESKNQQTRLRNIVQSDSFNCSDIQNGTSEITPARYLSNVHSSTSFDPHVQISNDHAQRGISNSENPQQRGESMTSAPQASGSVTSAQQTSGPDTNAQQFNGLAVSAQQSNGSNESAQSPARQSSDFVFVTYSWNGMTDPESLIQEVIEMCRALHRAGIRVKIDMDETSYAALRLNRLDWIDRNVREARYVIVCVTPTYAADIREPDPRNQASPRSGQLNARYIFDKLRVEYYNNSSQNRRVIPVVFSNYGPAQIDFPSCMRSTLIYNYPEGVQEIIAAILGNGKFRPS